jgi:hypothetical protein
MRIWGAWLVVGGMLGFLKMAHSHLHPPARYCQIGPHLSSPGFLFIFFPFRLLPLLSLFALLSFYSSLFNSHQRRLVIIVILSIVAIGYNIRLLPLLLLFEISSLILFTMKFATLLFTAAGVSAASSATSPDTPGSTCLADYILED